MGESTITAPPSSWPNCEASFIVMKPPKLWPMTKGRCPRPASAEAGIRDHCAHLCGADIRAIALAPAAVPHARQVDRRHAKIAGEIRRDEAPPIGVCAATVDEQQAAVDGSRRFGRPEQIMDRAIFNDDVPRLLGAGDGPAKPLGGGRADLEIAQR